MTLENDLKRLKRIREQENAPQDYIDTMRHAVNALRDQALDPQAVFQPFDNLYSEQELEQELDHNVYMAEEQQNPVLPSGNERPTPEQLEELAQSRLNSGVVFPRGHGRVRSPDYIITREDVARWERVRERIRNTRPLVCTTHPPEIKIKTPLMDRKYPHFCHNDKCKTRLQYRHAYDKARAEYEGFTDRCDCKTADEWRIKRAKEIYDFKKQFRKWWRSKYVKFLCCTCYRNATQPTMQEQLDHLRNEVFSVEFRDELDNDYYEDP